MPEMINVCFINGVCRQYEKGTTLMDISRQFAQNFNSPIVAGMINNDIKDMSTKLDQDCNIECFDLTSEVGAKVYQNSLIFLMVLAARDLFPEGQVLVEHSLSKGIYCELSLNYPLTREDVKSLEARMQEIVQEDRPIVKRILPISEAIRLFEILGRNEKVQLLKDLNRETATIYFCGSGYDYVYSTMVPSTGYLKNFKLMYYPPGLILRFPLKEDPSRLPDFIEMPKLGRVFQEAKQWSKIVDCAYIGQLNEQVSRGKIEDVILMAEALHEKKIAEIADHIFANKNRLKLVMVAGPTSSGKTTFIQRLSVQLQVLGINTIKISIDDYFIDREKVPLVDDQPDFESLDVVDIGLFNKHITLLMEGEEVELPRFDFPSGKQVPSGKKVQVNKRQLLIIEGLHGLNERLTKSIPRQHKTKIYISPLAPIGVDQHGRVPSTDIRLIRRIVRDSQFRAYDALQTIRSWSSVRRGEEGNIFPLTEEADIMFNSALIYELAVLRTFAVPLLQKVGSENKEHGEARRLERLLNFFYPVTDAEIPLNSILREFIGKSCFFN